MIDAAIQDTWAVPLPELEIYIMRQEAKKGKTKPTELEIKMLDFIGRNPVFTIKELQEHFGQQAALAPWEVYPRLWRRRKRGLITYRCLGGLYHCKEVHLAN